MSFARGTRLLMGNASIATVERVTSGDIVMTPTGPAPVTHTSVATKQLFTIRPIKGESWVCGADQSLSLRCGEARRRPLVSMSPVKFLALSPRAQQCFALYRSGPVSFVGETQVLEPWLLGYWLGDGASRLKDVRVASADAEVSSELELIAERHGMRLARFACTTTPDCHFFAFSSGPRGTKGRNTILTEFRRLGLDLNKHIPSSYLRASVADRRELLAGLLDSDGHVYRGNSVGSAVFCNKNRTLAEGVATLARSLGLAAYVAFRLRTATGFVKGASYIYNVNISGDLTQIPNRILRKQAGVRTNRKNVLHVGLSVEAAGAGEAFTLDVPGGLILLADTTVANASLVEKLEVDPDHIKKLATALLKQRGETQNKEQEVA